VSDAPDSQNNRLMILLTHNYSAKSVKSLQHLGLALLIEVIPQITNALPRILQSEGA